MRKFVPHFMVLTLLASGSLFAQAPDSVDVTFTYVSKGNPSAVYLPGEFNSWANNSNGVIPSGSPTAMSKDPVTGVWSKTVWLRVGGPLTGGKVSGAYQYKFNENGTSTGWLPDPLNPLQNPNDNNNSVVYTKSPTIFHLLPNSRSGIVNSQQPIISAYIFPSLVSGVDTSSFSIQIDSAVYKAPGTAYSPTTNQLTFLSPVQLQNGTRTVRLTVKNLAGSQVSDSASFIVQAGAIQILNQGGYVTRKTGVTLSGSVQDTSIHLVRIVQNGVDTTAVQASGGSFSFSATYTEGLNTFVALATDSAGDTLSSGIFTMTYYVNHSPNAVISFSSSGSSIIMSAESSSDPDSGQTGKLTFLWSVDSTNPSSVAGVQGATTSSILILKPSTPGEYYFSLIVSDPDGNRDTTRSYFTLDKNDSIYFPTYASNPEWAKMGRIYELFFNSFTPEKTINAAAQKLEYIRQLGFNIIWVMPVMTNNQAIDNGPGPGYNIVDFYTVAPQYGTNEDFKNFVRKAHQLGMKVILDVTPNHTSFNHPFVKDARLFGTNSFYWNFYVHSIIGDNNGLGSSLTSDGFFYYSGFSDQLLNYNWKDVDARAYMDDVYGWWVKEMGVDGYRFDVYWGPHNRTNNGSGGETEMGIPTRTLLKHTKPDIFILGETAGTGVGTEVNYADDGGGIDAGYDWNLMHNAIQSFNFGNSSSIANLNNYVTNFAPGGGATMGFVPGPNSQFMRGMENHDEDRIAYTYGSYAKTMPMATVLFTVPGIPMVYSGQEVGWGLGISDYDRRRRGVIDWNNPGGPVLIPHYQKLAWIRGTFPAFSTQTFFRLTISNSWVYGYTRPYPNQNGVVLANFDGASVTTNITLVGSGNSSNVYLPGGAMDGKTYYMNDVYNDTSYTVTLTNGSFNFSTTLPAYASAVYILSDSIIHMNLPEITSVEEGDAGSNVPTNYSLSQNYPNPFNPTTIIRYTLPKRSFVRMDVYNTLGQRVRTLANTEQGPGTHEVIFDGGGLASGVYFYKLSAGAFVRVNKMLMLK